MKSKTAPLTPPPTTPAVAMIAADQLAGLCNLTRRRLYQLAEESKIPTATNGQFPMLATISALFSYYQRDGEQYDREKLLKLTAERRQEERKDRIAEKMERRDYLEATQVSAILEIGIKQIENIPEKISSEFATPPALTKRLQQLLDEARSAWSKQIQTMPDAAEK